MGVPVLDATKHWECPSCGRQHVTRTHRATSELHACPSQKGMIVPFVEVPNNHGLARGLVRHVVVERDDYVGKEVGLRFDGEDRPIMNVRTERADGSNDCHVFPAAATVSLKEVS